MTMKTVDKLTITFLVDDCIEWMTKLPPGFTHELRQHLSDDPPLDEVTGVPFVDLENYCCGAHGFSALIETEVEGSKPRLTLFDVGPDSRSLVRNIHSLKIPHSDIERVIISHWHADHSGGLLSFLGLRDPSTSPCIIDLHPDRPVARGIAPPPTFDKVMARLPPDPTFELIESAGGKVEVDTEGHAVADDTVWVSGEIPRITDFEGGLLGGSRWIQSEDAGKWINEEHLMDERYLCVDVVGKGLVIFSACSHAGIVNVVKDALSKFSRPIHMIVGGLHLAGPELNARIPLTVDFLSRQMRPSPTYILPMHCSGFNAKIALQEAFGEGCVPAGVGLKVEVKGDRMVDDKLFPPVF